ncbi:acyl-CoA reductase [Pedobacter deserti]|uniref:acyl-CoA reductase n=1 Tax=Pedobacter deserti TaxID=2817382 RepID=UPI00210E20AE|nr:acyl-CoA reductase [Pedobacter sp. SYSU D00382]
MLQPDAGFETLIASVKHVNNWFTEDEVRRSLQSLSDMLNETDLHHWLESISIGETPKRVGLILAGNIPLVGFHDVLCVLATGNTALIKLSSSDGKLLPALLSELTRIEPLLAERILFTERLKDFDAVIATGSNNSARYFEYYFSRVPHIIRKNRNSVAVLTGDETEEQIAALGHDIFDYFGLGCRNVSKIYIPSDYDVSHFFIPLEGFASIADHNKYKNNYDYNKSVYLVNQVQHLDNGFLLLKEDEAFSSPLSVLYFERYNDLDVLRNKLNEQADNLQCVVTHAPMELEAGVAGFGQSQRPKLWDYADNINTVEFLSTLDK